ERSSIVPVAQYFGSHFVILPNAVVLSDPGNLGKHSAKRRAYNLLRASHMFHQPCDFLCPGNSFTCHPWECSCRSDDGYHYSSPSKDISPGEAAPRPQLLQQRLRFLQIARVKPIREPPVDRSEHFASLLQLALVAPEACEAHGVAASKF